MINELIEQIGGRDVLINIAELSAYGNRQKALMASALLAVLDAQNKTALVLRPFGYDGETFRKSDIDHHAAVVYYTAPPAASAPDRNQLRELVDMVWNEATESETVPSTADADRIIDKVFHGIVQEPASSRYQSAAPSPGGDGG